MARFRQQQQLERLPPPPPPSSGHGATMKEPSLGTKRHAEGSAEAVAPPGKTAKPTPAAAVRFSLDNIGRRRKAAQNTTAAVAAQQRPAEAFDEDEEDDGDAVGGSHRATSSAGGLPLERVSLNPGRSVRGESLTRRLVAFVQRSLSSRPRRWRPTWTASPLRWPR